MSRPLFRASLAIAAILGALVPAQAQASPSRPLRPAPARTPPDSVARFNQEIVRALCAPDMQQRFAALGLIPLPMTPEEFSAKLRRDAEHHARMVKLAGARGE